LRTAWSKRRAVAQGSRTRDRGLRLLLLCDPGLVTDAGQRNPDGARYCLAIGRTETLTGIVLMRGEEVRTLDARGPRRYSLRDESLGRDKDPVPGVHQSEAQILVPPVTRGIAEPKLKQRVAPEDARPVGHTIAHQRNGRSVRHSSA